MSKKNQTPNYDSDVAVKQPKKRKKKGSGLLGRIIRRFFLVLFTLIILPLAKTVLAVMAINTFMSSWNNFFWPFLVTNDPAMYTIQVGLKQFKFANETLFAPMMAGATISALPMFIMFFSLQKYFMEGVTIGAVKG